MMAPKSPEQVLVEAVAQRQGPRESDVAFARRLCITDVTWAQTRREQRSLRWVFLVGVVGEFPDLWHLVWDVLRHQAALRRSAWARRP